MDILALSNLLQESQSSGHIDKYGSNEKQVSFSNHTIITPASFGPPMSKSTSKSNTKPEEHTIDDSGAIWSSEEVPSITTTKTKTTLDNNPNDDREEPTYEIHFKQELGTEDIFLGNDNKTSGSFDCSHVVVKVYFPNTAKDELNLDVKSQCLFVESSTK